MSDWLYFLREHGSSLILLVMIVVVWRHIVRNYVPRQEAGADE